MTSYVDASHSGGGERTGEHIKDTEILCEFLLGVAKRGPSGNFLLCFPLHREKFKEKIKIKHYSDLQR